MSPAEEFVFWAALTLAAYLMFINARANARVRRERADAKLAALVIAALDDVDDYPTLTADDGFPWDNATPIHDDLAAARLRRQLDQWGAGA